MNKQKDRAPSPSNETPSTSPDVGREDIQSRPSPVPQAPLAEGQGVVLAEQRRFERGPAKKPEEHVLERMQKVIEARLEGVSDPVECIQHCWDLADDFEYQGEPWGAVLIYAYLVERDPKDLQSQLFLSDALIEVGELEQALALAEDILGIDPENGDAIEQIVRLLVALGRDWRTYPFESEPIVTELGEETRTRCVAWLRANGAADFLDLKLEVFEGEILLFDQDALAELLADTPSVERIDDGLYPVWAPVEG